MLRSGVRTNRKYATVNAVVSGGGYVATCQLPMPPGEVGRFGSRLRRAAKKVAKSKAFKALAKAGMQAAKATPYGAAADRALKLARAAAKKGRKSMAEAARDVGPAAVRDLEESAYATVAPSARADLAGSARLLRYLPPRERRAAARAILRGGS